MNGSNYIILFDGICNLCNGAVNFIIDHDPGKKFRFASLQSEAGKKILSGCQLKENYTDSIVLVKDNHAYVKSKAVMLIAREMNGLWSGIYWFRIIPAGILDFFYDIIARSRYRFFGRMEVCRIPTPDLYDRFME